MVLRNVLIVDIFYYFMRLLSEKAVAAKIILFYPFLCERERYLKNVNELDICLKSTGLSN